MTHTLTIDGQALSIQPDQQHEFLMTTEQVALGYSVSVETIRTHKRDHSDELFRDKHFLSVGIPNARPGQGAQSQTLWTKRGIVRLGFFIRSARARQFRDMAEDLVIGQLEQASQEIELISARMIGESTGQSRRTVVNYLASRGRVVPVAEYQEPNGNNSCFLYPLAAVATEYAAWALVRPFQPHVGPVRPLIKLPVLRVTVSQPKATQRLPAPGRPEPELARLLLETSRQLTQTALALMDQR